MLYSMHRQSFIKHIIIWSPTFHVFCPSWMCIIAGYSPHIDKHGVSRECLSVLFIATWIASFAILWWSSSVYTSKPLSLHIDDTGMVLIKVIIPIKDSTLTYDMWFILGIHKPNPYYSQTDPAVTCIFHVHDSIIVYHKKNVLHPATVEQAPRLVHVYINPYYYYYVTLLLCNPHNISIYCCVPTHIQHFDVRQAFNE